MAQAAALIALKGYGAPEVELVHAAARSLCADIDDPSVLGPVLYGLWEFALLRAHMSDAAELADEIEARAQPSDTALLLQALNVQAMTHVCMGEPVAAAAYIERSLALYQPALHRRLGRYYADPGALGYEYAGVAAWLLGSPTRARHYADEALRLAEELAPPGGICQTLWYVGLVYQLCGDVGRVQALSDELIRVGRHHELPAWTCGGMILNGWTQAQLGDPHRAIEQIRVGLAGLDAAGEQATRPYDLYLLAEASAALGDTPSALDATTTALDLVERTGVRWCEAELIRRPRAVDGTRSRSRPRSCSGRPSTSPALRGPCPSS
jgi:predicted ATPase